MKLSRYLVATPSSRRERWLLFSTLSRAIAEVPELAYRALIQGDALFDHLGLPALRRAGILVEDGTDEDAVYRHWSCQQRYGACELSITLVMTYDCNCACTYCYEAGIRQTKPSERMSRQVADDLVRWIGEYVDRRQTRSVSICFHGGEPLLALDCVEHLSRRIRDLCRERELEHHYSMVTNGTQLTQENVARMRASDIESIQVTLDGTHAMHDARRPFRDGTGTFDITLRNLVHAVDHFRVHIALTLDRQNGLGVGENLARCLTESQLGGKIAGIILGYLKATIPTSAHYREYGTSWAQFGDLAAAAHEAFLRAKLPVGELLKASFCTMRRDGWYVIDPRGDVYKCITGVGNPAFQVGHIATPPAALENGISKFLECDHVTALGECRSCSYLPLCNGGCRHESWVRDGSIGRRTCMQDLWSRCLPRALRSIAAICGSDLGAGTTG